MVFLYRTAAFITFILVYYGMGWLNIVQVMKTTGMGVLSILAVSAWTLRKGNESRIGRSLNVATVSLFLLLSGFQSFIRDVFGVAHDDILVIDAIFNTNAGEASEFLQQNILYIGKHLVFSLVLIGLYWLVVLIPDRAGARAHENLEGDASPASMKGRRKVLLYVSVFLIAIMHFNPTMRKEDPLLYFPLRYVKWKSRLEQTRMFQEQINRAMVKDNSYASLKYSGEGPRTVVLVIGESTTRINMSLYGYPRNTTPELESLDGQLLKFNDVLTTKGSTLGDIRLILGPATRNHPELYNRTPDLLSMAKKTGYKTFWITNQGTDMQGGLAVIASHADYTVNANKGGSRGEGSYDEVVFPFFTAALDDPAPRKFIVLHLLGGHPAFYFRYPESFARFNDADDEVKRRLKSEGRSYRAIKMRNYYDNAILYMDHVLKTTIDICMAHEDQPVAWIFVPDHGEDVAHYSNFVGHNTNVLSMFEIPMLFWMSRSFPLDMENLKGYENRPYQTDRLDHTLLGLMAVKGDYYDPAGDVLSPDFQPEPRILVGKPYPWKQ